VFLCDGGDECTITGARVAHPETKPDNGGAGVRLRSAKGKR
jgi:hypothetical protein